jgi:hypothetical protein
MAGRNNVAFMYLKNFRIEWFIVGFLNRVLFLSDVDSLIWNVVGVGLSALRETSRFTILL